MALCLMMLFTMNRASLYMTSSIFLFIYFLFCLTCLKIQLDLKTKTDEVYKMNVADRTRVTGCRINYTKNHKKKCVFKVFTSNIIRKRAFPQNRIMTINYFGTKRAWIQEFELIYNYVCNNYSTGVLVDCFGGSGFLSLLASRTNLFNKIHLNELAALTINYHYVMKDSDLFNQFCYYLSRLNELSFNELKVSYDRYTSKRVQVRKASVKRAVLIFEMFFYAFRGNGAYVNLQKRDNRKILKYPPSDYVEPLKQTHLLYQKIELTQFYYKKVMKSYLHDSHALIMLDPPYLDRTLIKKGGYACNFTFRQHRYLLQELTKQVYEAKVVLSGFDDELYNHYFDLFNRRYGITWHNVRIKRLGKRKNNPRHEHIWVNFDVTTLVNQYTNLFELIY